MRISTLFLAIVTVAACAPPAPPAPAPLQPLPALDDAPTNRTQTLVPVHAPTPSADNPALPANISRFIDDDLGALDVGPGEDLVVRTDDGAQAPAPGAHPHRLVRFVHLADIQLMDDESPGRAADLDSREVTSAIRPHDPLICRMLNAAVRTVNGLHAHDPLDFLLLGGDNADAAQENEVRWVMQILDGSDHVHCDSGDDNDMVPHAADGKDVFASAGLAMPWHWVSGNHDVLVQGNLAVGPAQSTIALGRVAEFGTREYSGGGFGSVLDGDVAIPDAQRRLLDGPALLTLVGGDGDGHGLAHADAASGKAFHSFDVPGAPITFLVLDTTHAAGGGEGVLRQSDIDRFVKPVLDDAQARGRVVVLASHHSVESLTTDGGIFGHAETDALLPDAWRSFLGAYPNVLFSMVGHAHRHRVSLQQTPSHPFWEVMTSALADWPHQMRIVEIWDDDNGTLRLETSPVDFVATDDPPAALGRSLGLVDFLSGWQSNDGRGDASDRNVALIVKKPAGIGP